MRSSLRYLQALTLAVVSGVAGIPALTYAVENSVVAEIPTKAQKAFNGVWLPTRPTQQLLTTDGGEPPLLPDAKALYEERRAMLKAGDRSFDRTTWCASPGLPRFMFIMHPFEIAVSERRIAFLYSWSNWYRTVDMSGETWEVEEEYSSVGVGMGRWEGDTLVINTTGLRSGVVLDREGLPHSSALQLTEHARLLSDDVLEVRFTFDDPETYVEPWDTVMTYARQSEETAQEFICLDEIKRGRPGLIEK